MKKNDLQETRRKTKNVLLKESEELKAQIAKLKLESKINPRKDTNLLSKKRKKLAVLLTVLRELT